MFRQVKDNVLLWTEDVFSNLESALSLQHRLLLPPLCASQHQQPRSQPQPRHSRHCPQQRQHHSHLKFLDQSASSGGVIFLSNLACISKLVKCQHHKDATIFSNETK